MPVRRAAAAVLLMGLVLVVRSPAASAHAVLLSTDPSPQTTLARSPEGIRLVFSEGVEAVFGAVRVFDVDGRRVDAGKVGHPGGNRRELLLPVDRLADGTYSVTWRVVSDDGHPVRGGFSFYVGAPSSISAVAIAEEPVAGLFVGWAAGTARFAWYLGLTLLVGAVVVRRWVWTPAAIAAAVPDAAVGFRWRFRRRLPIAWAVVAVTGALSLVFQAAKVSGLPLGDAVRPAVVDEILGTAFGRLWRIEMVLAGLLLVPVVVLARRRRPPWLPPDGWIAVGGLLAAGLAVVAALNGHARTDSHPGWAATSASVHLLAVSVWVGGLLALVLLGGPVGRSVPPDRRGPLLREVLRRFSPLAVVGVLVVVATGVANSLFNFDSLSDLWRVTHGRTVLAKVIALGVALAVAARHLLVLPRRLASPSQGGAARSFGWSSRVELAVLVGALALAAGLVDLVPGRTIALIAKGPVNLQQPAGRHVVQVFIDPTAKGDNELHVTFIDPSGLAAVAVGNTEVALGRGGSASVPIKMRVLSPGHFVGDVVLAEPGRYRLDVRAPNPGGELAATFIFDLSDSRLSQREPAPTGKGSP
jgi:copper transport protein